ncbi:MAG: MBL fold metallo-hydrolase [Chloroflexi bacterium]|nr:MAG: MBL fold metallo-hydrolase [Chloroflexota bacterium]
MRFFPKMIGYLKGPKQYPGRRTQLDTVIESKQPLQPVAQQPRHVHTITDRFSMANTYLIQDERFIVVDPGSVLNVQLLLAYMQRFLHRHPEDIDLIILTHLHPEHCAGVEEIRRASHAPVAVSIAAKRWSQSWAGEGRSVAGGTSVSQFVGRMFSQVRLPGVVHHLDLFEPYYERQAQLVDIWLDDVEGLPNHLDWRVIASPGLTPESLCLYNPFSYELLCGDTLITIEGGTILVRGGTNRIQLQQTLQTLQSLKVYYLYPGHGRPILSMRALATIEW